VRFSRYLLTFAVLPLALISACNRGVRPEQTGKVAPDFTVSDGTSTVHLADYRGKVVLLNFWATWCAPCVQELPGLLQLHRERPDIAILAVSVDEDADAYTSFIAERHVNLITVRDPSESAAKLYHSEAWPETYIIDKNGIIRRKLVGAADWSNPEIRTFISSL